MGLIDTIKDVLVLVQKSDNLDLLKKVLDLQTQAVEFQAQLQTKDEEIGRLRDALKLKDTVVRRGNLYFAVDDGQSGSEL